MKALINFKICDNAKECNGISVCPTGAMSFDEENETIIVDEEKCTNCGLCEKECPIGAIMVAQNEIQYTQYIQDIKNDPRKTKDLFVDRFGAAPLSEFFIIEEKDLNKKINNPSLTFIEIFDFDTVACLLKSIPIKDITDTIPEEVFYYKLEKTDNLIHTYNLSELPTLLIFKNGKLLGKIDGYYETSNKDEFKNKIEEIIK